MIGASPAAPGSALGVAIFDLRVMADACILIDAQDTSLASEFANLCCGLLPLRNGVVRFLGRDWARAADEHAAALRGRIGRLYGANSWVPFLGTDANILLPQLHHTRRLEWELREAAAQLACSFGLPGLPTARPDELSSDDLLRAACVRAFVGRPQLLIIEGSLLEQSPDLALPVVNALLAAKVRHTATIWLSCGDILHDDRALPVSTRLRLTGRGLAATRAPA
jgi:phospholipid/cholesterol/gamma-HCH transport system ATP-binding protein